MKKTIIFFVSLTLIPNLIFGAKIYKTDFERTVSVKDFSVLVGDWYRLNDKGNYVYVVDGKRWGNKLSGDIRPKIAKLFGEKYYAYMDNIKKYYYFPLAVYNKPINSQNYTISVNIKPISGKVDEAGGIVFGMKDPGNYYVLRSNVLENNAVLFGYKDGKRYTIKWIQFKKKNYIKRNVWHKLSISVSGTVVKGYLNGKQILNMDFKAGVTGKRRKSRVKFSLSTGKTGLWSKADSKTYFDNFTVKIK